jgi:hypothetical protein
LLYSDSLQGIFSWRQDAEMLPEFASYGFIISATFVGSGLPAF